MPRKSAAEIRRDMRMKIDESKGIVPLADLPRRERVAHLIRCPYIKHTERGCLIKQFYSVENSKNGMKRLESVLFNIISRRQPKHKQ